jgi:asparagine synthetase B (glutamine-hydrolysing)
VRPLINYLVVHSPDPGFRAELAQRWSGHPDFGSVDEGPGPWIRAQATLPFSSLARHDTAQPYWLGLAEGGENVDHPENFARDLEQNPESMARHAGDIGAILITASRVTVMRSPCGLVPWYIHRGDNNLIVLSTRFVWFQRHLPCRFSIDAFAHALATDGISCIDRRTPLCNVEALPVGHIVQINTSSTGTEAETLIRYWRPEDLTPSHRQPDDGAERGARLRQILINRLSADLNPNGFNLLGLSGGVDSSCLGALAVGPARRTVDAFTFLPGEDHPAFEEVNRFVRSISDVVRPGRHWRFPMTEQSSLASPQQAPSVGMPVPHPALSHLPAMVAEGGVVVYTGGEAADDLFAGPFVLGKDWIENVSLVQLARSLRRPWYGVARRFVAKQWLDARLGRRRLPIPACSKLSAVFRSEIGDEYQSWVNDLEARLKESNHPYRHLLLFFDFDGWLKQNWEVCSELGVRRSLPFWCRETIELALSTDPRIQALPPKRIIRLGMRGDVPRLNLDRPDKGAWSEKNFVKWDGGVLPECLESVVRPDLIGTSPEMINFGDASQLSVLIASTRPIR